jgi:hypothetical protein
MSTEPVLSKVALDAVCWRNQHADLGETLGEDGMALSKGH